MDFTYIKNYIQKPGEEPKGKREARTMKELNETLDAKKQKLKEKQLAEE